MEELVWPQHALGKKERSCRHTALDPVVSTKFGHLPWLPPPHNATLILRNSAFVQGGNITVTSLMLRRKGQKFNTGWEGLLSSGDLPFSPWMIKEESSQLDLRRTKHSGVWTGVKVIKEEVRLGWGFLQSWAISTICEQKTTFWSVAVWREPLAFEITRPSSLFNLFFCKFLRWLWQKYLFHACNLYQGFE